MTYATKPRVSADGMLYRRSKRKRQNYRTIDPKEVRNVFLQSLETRVFTIVNTSQSIVPASLQETNTCYEVDTGSEGRQGNEIYYSGTQFRALIKNNVAGSLANQIYLRLMCLQLRQGMSDTDLEEQFFDGTGSSSMSAQDFGSLPDKLRLVRTLNHKKFTVLYDQVHRTGTLLSGNEQVNERIIRTPYIPVNRTIKFDKAISNTQEQQRPAIFWVYFVEIFNDSATDDLTVDSLTKIWDKDL